jgi:ribA/ribD-fused uncharacterized protein
VTSTADEITYFTGEHRFLSNFWPARIIDNFGIVYPTVEHAYQAAKTLDQVTRERIARQPSPGAAKRAGRDVELRLYWDTIRLDVMWNLLLQKFAPGTELARMLLETGHAELVEGNHWGDTYWGVCDGRGKNHLGRLLMAVRSDLRERS